jgi:hypothetical protein
MDSVADKQRSVYDFHDPAYLSVFQPDLDTPGVVRSGSEQVLNDPVGHFSAALVFLQDDADLQAGCDIFSVLRVFPHAGLKIFARRYENQPQLPL